MKSPKSTTEKETPLPSEPDTTKEPADVSTLYLDGFNDGYAMASYNLAKALLFLVTIYLLFKLVTVAITNA